ncbi:MAG: hypothetical protein C0467_17770 [Planctomycetaceae bacterium]|nr:hypothetical protein [Planctomycetaceae bacterium]
MTSRERAYAILLIGLIVLGGGALVGYVLVYSPLQDKYAAAEKLEAEANGYDEKANAVMAARLKIAAVKRQSLPPDINQAKAQYKLLLEQLLRNAKLIDHKIPDMRVLDNRAPATPELVLPNPNANASGNAASPTAGSPPGVTAQSLKKPAYTRLEFKVEVKKADIWQVVDFLKTFYSVDLLHQITFINIVRDNKVTDPRNGLDLHLTIEAIILDKAEARKSLLPPNPTPAAVLAAKPRDYSFIAWKDMFYGVLPQPSVNPLTLGRFDSVTLERDEKPAEVKVRLSGDGAAGAKVVATASGSLLPEGELKVDPKTLIIAIPGVGTEDTPESATSTISVVATSPEGTTAKSSFKVAIAKPPVVETPKPRMDIASTIKLVIVSGRSDGMMKAVIFDAANPFKYEVTATGKQVEVLRFWQATGKTWKKDLDYEQPTGVLSFSDDFSATKRSFKVIAFEDDAVILSESGRPDLAKTETPKRGGGSRTGSGTAKQGPAEPLALVASNLATAIPTPTLYRWTLGKSLNELTKPSPTEAAAILKRIATGGPILNVTASNGK